MHSQICARADSFKYSLLLNAGLRKLFLGNKHGKIKYNLSTKKKKKPGLTLAMVGLDGFLAPIYVKGKIQLKKNCLSNSSNTERFLFHCSVQLPSGRVHKQKTDLPIASCDF